MYAEVVEEMGSTEEDPWSSMVVHNRADNLGTQYSPWTALERMRMVEERSIAGG